MKDRNASQVRQIRIKYRNTIDGGRGSGGGCIVTTFFDICSEIWAVSPLTESMSSCVEPWINHDEKYYADSEKFFKTKVLGFHI